ncbi:MAG: hypothetical protein ACHQF2_01960 [Flavobacteriales bacterium]
MNKTLIFVFTALTFVLYALKNPSDEANAIVAEGKLLYKSEMASWYGTDLFLAKYENKENIGGYFSYTDKKTSNCIFFSKVDSPKVIGTISFDSTYNVKTAKVNLKERKFTSFENNIYQLRKIALAEISTDTLFKRYKNTNFNLIPLISGKEKKVYVLTGPQQHGVVIFGNDYLLTFDKDNKLMNKKQLHKNIISISYGGTFKEGEQLHGTMHTHLPETGDYMTATDICTLLLYEKFTKWKTHVVVSQKYCNTWNCETNQLTVTLRDTTGTINKEKKD